MGSAHRHQQPLYRPLNQPTDAPFSYLYRRPTVAPAIPTITTPRTLYVQKTPARFNSFYSNLQLLKTVSSNSNANKNQLPAGFNLAAELEKMRTDRIQLKMGKSKSTKSSNPALN